MTPATFIGLLLFLIGIGAGLAGVAVFFDYLGGYSH